MTTEHHVRDLDEAHRAPTIVLVPGLDGTALLFYRQQPLLARQFNVVAFPLPDDPDAGMDDLVDDLAQLAEELDEDGVILLGESFGGALAMSTALAHPELVRGLIIVNSFPYIERRLQLRLAPLLLRAVPAPAMAAVRRITESRMHSPHVDDEDLREFHERSKQIGRRGYRRRLEILHHYDIRGRLMEIDTPTLFLAGTEDRLLPSVGWADFMRERVPDSDMVLLDGYGHICLINHDLDLLDHVGPWWKGVIEDLPRPTPSPTRPPD